MFINCLLLKIKRLFFQTFEAAVCHQNGGYPNLATCQCQGGHHGNPKIFNPEILELLPGFSRHKYEYLYENNLLPCHDPCEFNRCDKFSSCKR